MAEPLSTAPPQDGIPLGAAVPDAPLLRTPLATRHEGLGARMVPFAGYLMPVHYPAGILAEHLHTRSAAGLFDVSHMGQAVLSGASHGEVSAALETLVPADIAGLAPGRQRYTQLTGADGGTLDDLMVARSSDPRDDGKLLLVVNAGTKGADYAHLRRHLGDRVHLIEEDRALVAIQGPAAAAVLAGPCPQAVMLPFMGVTPARLFGVQARISRSGYTGEDGFEISVTADDVGALWDGLLADDRVKPIGLGARDSLRLEAGLCLYGHDLGPGTSPVEAGLDWSIQRRRREAGGFLGADRIQRELAAGPARLRVGLRPEGRAPVREGAAVRAPDGTLVGQITSGGFGPSVGAPIAMALVDRRFGEPDTPLTVELRGRDVPARVVSMPFVPHRFHR